MDFQWYNISASIIVWIIVLLISIYQFVVSFGDPKKGKRKTKVNEFGYSVKVVLSQPMNNFELKGNSINIQLIETKDKTNIAFSINKCKLTDAYKKSDLFGNQYFRLFFTIISKSKSFPMTHIKVAQTLTTGKIFVNGVEVEEQWTGRHLYYPINEWIKDEDIADAKQLAVKSHQLIFCSKQTFCPNFENPLTQEFGKEIDKKDRKTKAVIIRHTLEWFEVSVFYALLLNLAFLVQVLMIWIELKSDNKQTELYTRLALCTTISGLLPLIITDLFSGVYICVFIRANNVWSFVRVLYLFCMLVMSILSSIGTQVVFKRFGHNIILLSSKTSNATPEGKLEDQLYNLLVYIIVFMVSLFITFTVWILLLGLIKYCYNSVFHYPTADESYINDSTSTTESSRKTPQRKRKEEVITTPTDGSEKRTKKRTSEPKILPPKTSPKPTPSPQSVGSVKFTTDRLEEEIKQNSSDKKLVGNSVIHESTGSDGYLNPENFRLTK